MVRMVRMDCTVRYWDDALEDIVIVDAVIVGFVGFGTPGEDEATHAVLMNRDGHLWDEDIARVTLTDQTIRAIRTGVVLRQMGAEMKKGVDDERDD